MLLRLHMKPAREIENELRKHASSSKAKLLQGFFKTGPGEYGEGDLFLGVMVPDSRIVVNHFKHASLKTIADLLNSKYHEVRLTALLILVDKFRSAGLPEQKEIFDFYLNFTSRINNWDLVDLSAKHIVGGYLLNRPRTQLIKLARSKNIWERRIAILATFAFIPHHQFEDSFKLANFLLHDEHDLIHKAVGWMLREVGKKSKPALVKFLKPRYQKMPRTMFRYAIERFPESERQAYLKS